MSFPEIGLRYAENFKIGDWISFPEIDLAHTPKIRLTSIFENSSDSEGVFQNCTNVRLENKKFCLFTWYPTEKDKNLMFSVEPKRGIFWSNFTLLDHKSRFYNLIVVYKPVSISLEWIFWR